MLTSHDETRPVTRYGRGHDRRPAFIADGAGRGRPTSRSAPGGPGRRRCSCSRCPGGAYVYQGEELGLPDVDDLPDDVLQDPMFARSRRRDARP